MNRPPRDTLGDCRQYLQFERGRPMASMRNLCVLLREHGALAALLRSDREGWVWLMGPMPEDWEPGFEPRPICNDDITALHEFIEGLGLPPLSRRDLLFAVHRVAAERPFDRDEEHEQA